MISNRILVILFLFVAFGMFVYAAPVEEMVVRGGGGGGGGGTCGTPGCNEDDLFALLVNLKAKILVHIALLDGHRSALGPCNSIFAELRACAKAILALRVDTSGGHGSHYSDCHGLIAEIIALIVAAIGKYSAISVLIICIQLNLCLGTFLGACGTAIPGILHIVGTLISSVHVKLCVNFSLTLVLSLCGL